MFRVPKSTPVEDLAFYQRGYEQEDTTDLPDADRLERLKQNWFADIDKDYHMCVDILKALGVRPPSIVYDYGSSWGYGSWQFSQAGYRVYSYEIGRARARYAAENLGCQMLAEPEAVPERVDCLFASHVLEHLAAPEVLWSLATRVLRPDGIVVLFMPNGEPCREELDPWSFHRLWGRVHPLLLTYAAVRAMAGRHGFTGHGYTSPYDLCQIASAAEGVLTGDELLVVARRQAATESV
jgi:SAM-dependent methyltransferase